VLLAVNYTAVMKDDPKQPDDKVTVEQLIEILGLLAGYSAGPFGGLGGPFPIAADQVALELQDPSIGTPLFTNAISNGTSKWKTLSYAGLTVAALQGLVLQQQFANINTDNPDLTAFNNRKGKLILYHGLADTLIAPQGSDNYYGRVSAAMGGTAATQSFFRFFHIPGLVHSGRLEASPNVPVPQSVLGRDEMFLALQNSKPNSKVVADQFAEGADAAVAGMCLKLRTNSLAARTNRVVSTPIATNSACVPQTKRKAMLPSGP
jgi:hypothetical protein